MKALSEKETQLTGNPETPGKLTYSSPEGRYWKYCSFSLKLFEIIKQ